MSCMRNVWGKQSFPGRWSPASHPVQPLGVLQRAWTQINTQVFKKSSSILLFQCLQVQSQLPLHFFFRELLRIPWNWWDSLYAVSVHSVYSNRWQMEAMHNALTFVPNCHVKESFERYESVWSSTASLSIFIFLGVWRIIAVWCQRSCSAGLPNWSTVRQTSQWRQRLASDRLPRPTLIKEMVVPFAFLLITHADLACVTLSNVPDKLNW